MVYHINLIGDALFERFIEIMFIGQNMLATYKTVIVVQLVERPFAKMLLVASQLDVYHYGDISKSISVEILN